MLYPKHYIVNTFFRHRFKSVIEIQISFNNLYRKLNLYSLMYTENNFFLF